MGILETNKQFYDNLLRQKNPLLQFAGGFGNAVNDAFKAPVDAVKKEADQLKKEGANGYVNKKVEQAKKMAKVVHNANKEIVKHPQKAVNTTKNYIVDTMKEEWKKAKENPAATAGNVFGNAALMALDAGTAGVAGKVLKGGSKAANAVEKGVQKATSANTASKGITKTTPLEYPANTPAKKGTDFPETQPILKNMEDMKVVNTPKTQPNKESLVDINSLKKNPPSKAQPTINERLYNMENGEKDPLYLRIIGKGLDIGSRAIIKFFEVFDKVFDEDSTGSGYRASQEVERERLEKKRAEEDKKNAEAQRARLERLEKEWDPYYKQLSDMKKVDKKLRKKYKL